jgi:hypothetical protein
MGRFSRLLQAKGKDIKIGDEVFNIKPLTGKYLGLFAGIDENKQDEATFNMILASLRQTDESITLEDVKELPMGVISKIMEVISEVNEIK